jgi:hypothetical protein
MRRVVFAATLAVLMVGSLAPAVKAMAISRPELKSAKIVQDVACRRMYRCGPYGCRWRAVCWADPHAYPGSYYYGYDAPFDYGNGGFYYYYGGVPLRWSRQYRSYW